MSSSMAKAFAPGNISCIFSIINNRDPAKTGSTGMGFTVNEGVLVYLKEINDKKNVIKYNYKKINFPTVDSLIKKLIKTRIEVTITSKLPLGVGFGLSGASALATAYAINKSFYLKKKLSRKMATARKGRDGCNGCSQSPTPHRQRSHRPAQTTGTSNRRPTSEATAAAERKTKGPAAEYVGWVV